MVVLQLQEQLLLQLYQQGRKESKQSRLHYCGLIMAEPEISEAAAKCIRLLNTAALGEVIIWQGASRQGLDTREKDLDHVRTLVQILVNARLALGNTIGRPSP